MSHRAGTGRRARSLPAFCYGFRAFVVYLGLYRSIFCSLVSSGFLRIFIVYSSLYERADDVQKTVIKNSLLS
jgi:hypothetical protein